MTHRETDFQVFRPDPSSSKIPVAGRAVARKTEDVTYCLAGRGDMSTELGDILADTQHAKAYERPEACARKVSSKFRTTFFIKANNRGELFDPHDRVMVSEQGLRSMGMPVWQLKTVNQKSFDYYIQFLATSNKSLLDLARRNLEC